MNQEQTEPINYIHGLDFMRGAGAGADKYLFISIYNNSGVVQLGQGFIKILNKYGYGSN